MRSPVPPGRRPDVVQCAGRAGAPSWGNYGETRAWCSALEQFGIGEIPGVNAEQGRSIVRCRLRHRSAAFRSCPTQGDNMRPSPERPVPSPSPAVNRRWRGVRNTVVHLAGALALGIAVSGGLAAAQAQGPAKGSVDHIKAATQKVNGAFISANTKKRQDWPSYGLDYAETRFSRLKQIGTQRRRLGLAWSYNLESTRGVEATPLVVDGIMYVTASWSVVHAVDVRTGKRIWTYDPQGRRAKPATRAVATWSTAAWRIHKGKVFVGVLRRPADRARCRHRQGGMGEGHHHRPQVQLHHHRRAARVQGQGDHRQRRRRVRRARLHHRLRRQDRRPEMALVHRARRPEQAV